jgi:hypothetical protein
MKQSMQGNHLYEYAIIRVVPCVEREEFINVGVIVYCRKPAFLQTKFMLSCERLQAIFPALNLQEIEANLIAFEQIAAGNSTAGTIATLDMASRFRWLTAKRSTMVQTSAVHPGLCNNPAATLNHLFELQVL